MATTSSDTAVAALDALLKAGVRYAVLHGESELAAGRCPTDVDLVTDLDARSVLGRSADHLRRRGLHPILVCEYDTAAESVFLVDAIAREGVQLDLLHDRQGHGALGIRTDTVLAAAHTGVRWPRASAADEHLYLISKRRHKRQDGRLSALLASADGPAALRARAHDLFHDAMTPVITGLLGGSAAGQPLPTRARRRWRTAVRYGRRIRRPVGFWVALHGHGRREAAEQVAARLGRTLPWGVAVATSGVRTTPADLARVMACLVRPGVAATWGPRPPGRGPDLWARADPDHDVVISEVVSAMEHRLRL